MMKTKILQCLKDNKLGLTSVEISLLTRIRNLASIRSTLVALQREGQVARGEKRDCLQTGYFSNTYNYIGKD